MPPESELKPQFKLVKPVPLGNEAAIRDWIAENPDVLPLGGDLICRDKERVQPNGRLDLLLENEQGTIRYVVEIQLGAIDESHIVRAIEYWDWERTRYPYYDHRAVLLGEKTGRFFNVVSWANRRMPLILIQMLGVGGSPMGIAFNKILDVVAPAEDDSFAVVENSMGRDEWNRKVGNRPMSVVDDIHTNVVRPIAPQFELAYTRYYIGLQVNGRPKHMFKFRPQQTTDISITVRVYENEEWTKRLQESGIFDRYSMAAGNRGYYLRLPRNKEKNYMEVLKELFICALREAGMEGEICSGVETKDFAFDNSQ